MEIFKFSFRCDLKFIPQSSSSAWLSAFQLIPSRWLARISQRSSCLLSSHIRIHWFLPRDELAVLIASNEAHYSAARIRSLIE